MEIKGLMVTNGGGHPADKWADKTTSDVLALLVDANPDNVTPEAAAARQAKRDLVPVLFKIFNAHHEATMAAEKASSEKLAANHETAVAYACSPHDPTSYMKTVMAQVQDAFSKTPFAAHFAGPDGTKGLYRIIGQDTVDVMHLERRYHADRLAKGA